MDTPQLTTMRIERGPVDAVASLVLDRPDRLNALSRQLLEELPDACRWFDGRHDLKVVVIRGAGRAFSAGFDLSDFSGGDAHAPPRDTADLGRLAAEALTNVRQVTIASIHGHCVGGGVVLAASCDLRVAADDTRFSIPEVDLGIPLAWGGIPRLTRELGPAVTKELVLTCRPFDAAEAHDLRFVNTVVPAGDLDRTVDELAVALAEKPGFALRTTKQQVNAVTEELAGTGRSANDADTLVTAAADPESREAALRYLERRRVAGR
jgi:enoyl-CoA hydratase/carnithine racemase